MQISPESISCDTIIVTELDISVSRNNTSPFANCPRARARDVIHHHKPIRSIDSTNVIHRVSNSTLQPAERSRWRVIAFPARYLIPRNSTMYFPRNHLIPCKLTDHYAELLANRNSSLRDFARRIRPPAISSRRSKFWKTERARERERTRYKR